jgi:outer membrane biosynthesis protein TonB
MSEGRLPPANLLERTPPAPLRSDRVLFIAAGFVFVVIVALVGWAIWLRIPARAGKSAVVAQTTALPGPTAAIAGPATPELPEPEFVGPIQPPPSERPRTAASAKPVARAPSPVERPAEPVAPAVKPATEVAPRPTTPEDSRATTRVAPTVPVDRPRVAAVTYSASDADVSPPIAVSPQLIALLSRESPGNRPDVMTIAVVVNTNGTVDSVKAVKTPLSLGESVMLTAALSTVKAWHFRPAMKDGAPVKYRQIVPLRITASVP